MFKQIIALLALAILLGTASSATALDVEIAIGGWQQEFSGTLGFDEFIEPKDVIDIDNDFDFDKETRVYGRVRLDLPLFFPNLSFVAAPMKFEGTGSKTISFDYGNLTDIPIGATLDSEITLNQYDVALFWGIPALKTATAGMFNIDLGLNVRIVDLDARLRATDGGTFDQQDEASVNAPIPMLFVAVQLMPTDSVGIEAEGRGLAVGDNKIYSVIGRVRYNFAGPVFVAGGYRYDKIEIDEDDILADIEFSGPFAELGIKF